MLNIDIEKFITGLVDVAYYTTKYLNSYTREKHIVAERVSHVICYMNKKYRNKVPTEFLEKYMNSNKKERLLNILKYLYGGKGQRENIAEEMGISKRQLNDDLSELMAGFDFLGTKIKIDRINRKENSYVSMVHPALYALHTEEIYSLIIGLKLLGKNTVFEKDFDRIAELTYSQLSECAKKIIDIKAEKEEISVGPKELRFVNSFKMLNCSSIPITYFLKESIKCIVRYSNGGEKVEGIGILELAKGSSERFSRVV